jgi:hypothetical protein
VRQFLASDHNDYAWSIQIDHATKATTMRYPTAAERELWRHAWYAAITLAGVSIMQHLDDPTLGWVATWPTGQTGLEPSADAALGAMVRCLIRRDMEQLAQE